jgi:hypothetical protein
VADNVSITPGSGATVAADEIGGILYQRVKLGLGADGSAADALGGAGAVASGVQRVTLASDDPAVVDLAAIEVLLTTISARLADELVGEYETVAASQTAQVLGATGATGDYLAGLLIIPATTSPDAVSILDNATSITVFAGGASSVSDLKPFFLPLRMKSVSGAWKVTTGANVSCIGIGNFT